MASGHVSGGVARARKHVLTHGGHLSVCFWCESPGGTQTDVPTWENTCSLMRATPTTLPDQHETQIETETVHDMATKATESIVKNRTILTAHRWPNPNLVRPHVPQARSPLRYAWRWHAKFKGEASTLHYLCTRYACSYQAHRTGDVVGQARVCEYRPKARQTSPMHLEGSRGQNSDPKVRDLSSRKSAIKKPGGDRGVVARLASP
jgi:hypothetical protein